MILRLLLTFLLLGAGFGSRAQVQYSTENPRVEDINDRHVTIQRVDLTEQYTIIYMTFRSSVGPGTRAPQPRTRLPFPMPYPRNEGGLAGNTINFEPDARLYVNQGERSFRFIRAENIPTTQRRDVYAGERVDFVAYFERITPGYEVFDLFECSDRNRPGSTCFNFFGVHITNPALRKRQPDTQSRRAPAPPARPRPNPGYETTPPEERPEATEPAVRTEPANVSMKGAVRDAKTGKPVDAMLTYRLLSGAETTGDAPADSVRSSRPPGSYQIAAEPLSVYAVQVKAKGYFSQSDTLTVTRTDKVRDFELTPIEAGAKVTLKNIYFSASKFDLKPESYPELDRLVQLMKENPAMSIRLEGHTDTVGEFDANVELSRNRVNEVRRYLAGKGIDARRIETVGYGPSRPINTNKSLKERPENRRVEMVITKS